MAINKSKLDSFILRHKTRLKILVIRTLKKISKIRISRVEGLLILIYLKMVNVDMFTIIKNLIID